MANSKWALQILQFNKNCNGFFMFKGKTFREGLKIEKKKQKVG